ncbi:phosphoribosylanthranilate isomerase [Peribacillus kribbensis]|uniref:phosphoribosylanthranilate isomerase n=1 Tax=Peribacillus kribbensis TaxID=356658 RepID=UPI00042548A4|nr:phosphoribosylanthranilate isomerase [Peribacillus kribbensis]
MKVKICGIMDIQTAEAAAGYGADALGFVFAESKRKIEKETAREIISTLPAHIEKVGVFVDETAEEIREIAEYTGLTLIQLHGDEGADFIRTLGMPVIKGISFQPGSKSVIQQFGSEFILLDAPRGKYHGGNGEAFDWEAIRGLGSHTKNLILAGGLTPENVAEAVSIVEPYMVDVSSGVETDGRKDLGKIKRFIENAKTGVKENV